MYDIEGRSSIDYIGLFLFYVMDCNKCKKFKNEDDFYKSNKHRCKSCINENQKKWKLLNKDKISKRNKDRYIKLNLYTKKRKPKQESNEIKIIKSVSFKNQHIRNINIKVKNARNLEIKINKLKERNREKKLRLKVRKIISKAIIRGGYNKNTRAHNILGCDFETFKTHIERQFIDGMNWDNHGLYGWHYDHILPIATAKSYEDIIRLNHYTNLRPLWAKDNLSKSYKIVEHQLKMPI
jgi:hypothetical protein